MRWEEYKVLCERHDHFSRFALETTRAVLGPGPVFDALGVILDGEPVARPDDHRGGPETDHFSVALMASEVDGVIECLSRAVISSDESTRGRLMHLRVVWQEYASSLSRER